MTVEMVRRRLDLRDIGAVGQGATSITAHAALGETSAPGYSCRSTGTTWRALGSGGEEPAWIPRPDEAQEEFRRLRTAVKSSGSSDHSPVAANPHR